VFCRSISPDGYQGGGPPWIFETQRRMGLTLADVRVRQGT
jgi:hypothetical protein